MQRPQCLDRPAMRRDACGPYRQRPPAAALQARGRGTKMGAGSAQVQAILQRQRVTHQRPAAPRPGSPALPKGGVKPCDGSRVAHPSTVRATSERLDTRGRARYGTALKVTSYNPQN